MMKKLFCIAVVVLMLCSCVLSTSALVSPVGKDYYYITVEYDPSNGSLGTANSDKNKVEVDASGKDGEVTLTATKKGNGQFVDWTIDGKYDIISGSLTDPVMVIKPLSDIHALAKFVQPGSTPDQPKGTEKPNDSKTSPKTGDPTWMILSLAALGICACVVAVKKIKE